MFNSATISGRLRRKRIIISLCTVLVLVYILWPLAWMMISSFQKEHVLQSKPPVVFVTSETRTLNHYKFIFTGEIPADSTIMLQAMYTMSGTQVLPSVKNSLLIAVCVTILNLLLAVPAAHAFARVKFKHSQSLFMGIFSTRMLPAISLVIPIFYIANSVQLLDSLLLLVIINTAISLPFTLWLLRGFFEQLPLETEEAALIDGASKWKTLIKVVLPLTKPALIATGVFAFMTTY